MSEYDEALNALGYDSALGNALRQILLQTNTFSLPAKTMGGRYLWNDIASLNGWRIQQSKLTGRIRILDPDDMRIASGTNTRMSMVLQRMADFVRGNKELERITPEKALEDVFAYRDKLRVLCDSGQISPEGFSTQMKPFAEKARYLLKMPNYDELPTLSSIPYILSRRKLSPAVKYPACVLSAVACVCLWVGIVYLLKG